MGRRVARIRPGRTSIVNGRASEGTASSPISRSFEGELVAAGSSLSAVESFLGHRFTGHLDVRACPNYSSFERITTSFLICMSSIVWGIPPTPRPDSLRPAKGIQSTRKAGWSLTITAEASSRREARSAVSRSLVNTDAWKA